MQDSRSHSNQGEVLKILATRKSPMSAYDILDALRSNEFNAIKAPTQVYRALERLMKDGEVHRVAALNAFVRCSCAHEGRAAGFVICVACGVVKEFDAIAAGLPTSVSKRFSVAPASYEISGTCLKCQKQGVK